MVCSPLHSTLHIWACWHIRTNICTRTTPLFWVQQEGATVQTAVRMYVLPMVRVNCYIPEALKAQRQCCNCRWASLRHNATSWLKGYTTNSVHVVADWLTFKQSSTRHLHMYVRTNVQHYHTTLCVQACVRMSSASPLQMLRVQSLSVSQNLLCVDAVHWFEQ